MHLIDLQSLTTIGRHYSMKKRHWFRPRKFEGGYQVPAKAFLESTSMTEGTIQSCFPENQDALSVSV